ncbi:diadenylate cyclase [Rubrobacter marinus]|uniref:diadenylate cyclase n=1 Tax=Rubrobacter marinus TaxID=2653852 RepID=UPI00140E5F10|nr:diadenylate cyclase [Rubrobacter marinus]
MAHLIAGLSAVDGAVVMTKRFEILGFGAEISGALPPARTVARALDPEGERVRRESTDGVGTRHRSAYRLCGALPGSVAVVVSQDGGVRFVTRKDGEITYWNHA